MNVVWETIIAAILAITNFSIKTNPKAPGADAILEHAVDDADFAVHLDWESTVAANYATFARLPDDALIKQLPDLRKNVRDGITQAEAARGMAKAMIGFDPIDDLTSVTLFAKAPRGNSPPELLVVARGKFPADLASKLGKQAGGKETTIDGRVAVTMPDGQMIGLTKGGALIAGKSDWVAARIKNDWKAPARTRGSAWARIATALDARPFFLVASKPSADAVKTMTAQLDPSFGRDLIAGHELALLAASSTGISWVFDARDLDLAKRIKVASEGFIELMRAAHLAPRGMAQIAIAALPSYAKVAPGIDAVLASKDKLMAAVWELTGDGKFAASVKLDGDVVIATTRGKKLSDVVPASFFAGIGAATFLFVGVAAKPPVAPTTTYKPAPPRSGGGLGTPVKPTPKPAPKTH